jgi:phage shock protein A
MQNSAEPTTIAAAATAVGTAIAAAWVALKRRPKGPDMLLQRIRRLEDDSKALKNQTAVIHSHCSACTTQLEAMAECVKKYEHTTERIFDKLEEVGRNANTALTILAERRRE